MADSTHDVTSKGTLPDATLVHAPGLTTRDRLAETLVPPSDPASGGRSRSSSASVFDGEAKDFTGYELLEEIGRGGMGVVYKARQRALNRLVALKMVLSGAHGSSGELSRFRAEAEVVARLQHPHIVQIYEIGEQGGRPYLALELVTGSTLQKTLAGTPQPPRPAAHLIELLARAIHFAHQRGVVHRDLKPGNVLLARTLESSSSMSDADGAEVASLYGTPKITDFGLAKRLEDNTHETCSGDILGTPSYMAPEQAAGQAFAAGPEADVYALGAMLYEMLTGRPPFKGATTMETLHQVINEDPVPPGRLRPRLPKDLERICLKCLEKDPRRRYASALDLADDLRRQLNGESVHVRPAPPLERLWRWSRRNPVPASLLLAITLGAGFGFWHLSNLSKSLVQSTALEGAVQQAETMNELNRYYGRVASHLKEVGVDGLPGWDTKPGPTMPAPATMTIELGQQISERSESGMQVRLYSDFPFSTRRNRPPPDEFEREALTELRRNPSQPFYRYETLDGRPVLRFATARVMEAGCVNCHNKHPDRTPDWPVWKEGDVRGVLEIIRPLDVDQERINRGLRGTVGLVAGSGATLLGLSVCLIYLGNRRRRSWVAGSRTEQTKADTSGDATPTQATRSDEAEEIAPSVTSPPEPIDIAPTLAAAATVPANPTVVWQSVVAISDLTPVRLVAPGTGMLRIQLLVPEDEPDSGELRVESNGEVATARSMSSLAPVVELPVESGRKVVVRIKSTTSGLPFTISAELLVHPAGQTGAPS